MLTYSGCSSLTSTSARLGSACSASGRPCVSSRACFATLLDAWPLPDAALGGELEVPTLDGRVKLRIPEETQTGRLFRMRGKGVRPVRGGEAGDLLCRVVVETPVKLTSKQKDLLEEFRSSLAGRAHSPKEKSWFDGVRNFFDDLTS